MGLGVVGVCRDLDKALVESFLSSDLYPEFEWDTEKNRTIFKEVVAGVSRTSLCKKYNISVNTCDRILSKYVGVCEKISNGDFLMYRLGSKAYNSFKRSGIKDLDAVVAYYNTHNGFKGIRNMGKSTEEKVIQKLKELGCILNDVEPVTQKRELFVIYDSSRDSYVGFNNTYTDLSNARVFLGEKSAKSHFLFSNKNELRKVDIVLSSK